MALTPPVYAVPQVNVKLNHTLEANKPVLDFRVSPDGSRIAYRVARTLPPDQDNPPPPAADLYSIPASGGAAVQLNPVATVETESVESYQFSADGSEIPIEASISQSAGEHGTSRTMFLRDIRERQAREAEIDRLRRLHVARTAVSQAMTMMKPGLRNSEGCTEAKPRLNQRTAPLPKSVPNTGSSASAMNDNKNPSTPSRRTISGVSIDVPNIASSASPPKKA